jgi:hypothetical protein
MSKIPKDLSDKEMLKGWADEASVEDQFRRAEAAEKARRRREEPVTDLAIAYLTPDIVASLGRELLALKLQLATEGVPHFKMKIRRDGHDIILSPSISKK